MTTRTAHLHAAMLRTQGYRTGDLTHETLGDIEIECRECHGEGLIEDGPLCSAKTRVCPNCDGHGTVWIEGREETP